MTLKNSSEVLAAAPTVTVTLPGKFCDWFNGTNLAQGCDDSDPECKALRLAYENAPVRRNSKGYYAKITTGDDAVLSVLAEYAGYCHDSNIDEPNAAEVRAADTVEARAVAARRELRAAQEDARNHTVDEAIPDEALVAAPGAVVVVHDHGMTHQAWRDREVIGAVIDETAAGLARGGWAAWSPKCSNRGGTIDWYATQDEAADAIDKAWPTPATEQPAPTVEQPAKPDAAPEWRTLRGVQTPFLLHVDRLQSGGLHPTGNRTKAPTGFPVKVVQAAFKGSTWTACTDEGAPIHLGGAASRMWITRL